MLVAVLVACSAPQAARDPGAAAAAPAAPAASVVTSVDPTDFTAAPMSTVPMLGGTLEAIPELDGAIAADPDGNQVVVAVGQQPAFAIALGDNARPFRIEVEGSTAWVTLRGTGEVVEIDVPTGAIDWRTKVCAEPRGLDHGPDGALVVACAGGELVALDANGAILHAAVLDSDLRDVVSADGILYVSRFRAGEILLVDPTSFAVTDVAPLGVSGRVAWRMRPNPASELGDDGGVLVLFDEVSTDPIQAPNSANAAPEYYVVDTSCQSLHQAEFATVGLEGYAVSRAKIDGLVLPVDFAVASDESVLVVNGGAGPVSLRKSIVDVGSLTDVLTSDCLTGVEWDVPGDGLAVGVAETDGTLWLETQAASAVLRSDDGQTPTFIWQSGEPDATPDTPFALFHQDAGTGIACASCHPDGQDDAMIWQFSDTMPGVAEGGPRRTLTLAGSLGGRAPYHWMGELPTASALVDSTFTLGMGGRAVDPAVSDGLFAWLDGLRPVHRASVADADAIARGAALFASQACADCHGTDLLTDDQLHAVRPHESPTKTPSLLGLGMRASFFHDGCAKTLDARFTGPEACTGGDLHGTISTLDAAQIEDLTAWLERL